MQALQSVCVHALLFCWSLLVYVQLLLSKFARSKLLQTGLGSNLPCKTFCKMPVGEACSKEAYSESLLKVFCCRGVIL